MQNRKTVFYFISQIEFGDVILKVLRSIQRIAHSHTFKKLLEEVVFAVLNV